MAWRIFDSAMSNNVLTEGHLEQLIRRCCFGSSDALALIRKVTDENKMVPDTAALVSLAEQFEIEANYSMAQQVVDALGSEPHDSREGMKLKVGRDPFFGRKLNMNTRLNQLKHRLRVVATSNPASAAGAGYGDHAGGTVGDPAGVGASVPTAAAAAPAEAHKQRHKQLQYLQNTKRYLEEARVGRMLELMELKTTGSQRAAWSLLVQLGNAGELTERCVIAASKDCLGSLQIQELLTLVENAYGFAPTVSLRTLVVIMLLAEGDYVGAGEVLDAIQAKFGTSDDGDVRKAVATAVEVHGRYTADSAESNTLKATLRSEILRMATPRREAGCSYAHWLYKRLCSIGEVTGDHCAELLYIAKFSEDEHKTLIRMLADAGGIPTDRTYRALITRHLLEGELDQLREVLAAMDFAGMELTEQMEKRVKLSAHDKMRMRQSLLRRLLGRGPSGYDDACVSFEKMLESGNADMMLAHMVIQQACYARRFDQAEDFYLRAQNSSGFRHFVNFSGIYGKGAQQGYGVELTSTVFGIMPGALAVDLHQTNQAIALLVLKQHFGWLREQLRKDTSYMAVGEWAYGDQRLVVGKASHCNIGKVAAIEGVSHGAQSKIESLRSIAEGFLARLNPPLAWESHQTNSGLLVVKSQDLLAWANVDADEAWDADVFGWDQFHPENSKFFAAQNDNLPGLAARLDSQYGIVIGTKEMFYSRFVKLF